MIWLLFAGTVLGVNLLPALGPPTWLVIVAFRLNSSLPLAPLVIIGALSATTGRCLLAIGTRKAARWLPQERVRRLEDAGEAIRARPAGALAAMGLFFLSPLPSAQLFEAAGVMRVPLRPLAATFLLGRMVSYSLYGGAAAAADRKWGNVVRSGLTSWPSIALQIGLLVLVWQLSRIDLAKRLGALRAVPRLHRRSSPRS